MGNDEIYCLISTIIPVVNEKIPWPGSIYEVWSMLHHVGDARFAAVGRQEVPEPVMAACTTILVAGDKMVAKGVQDILT